MTRKNTPLSLSFFALLLLSASLVSASLAHAAEPNFIVIFTDDQGYGDLSCFASGSPSRPMTIAVGC